MKRVGEWSIMITIVGSIPAGLLLSRLKISVKAFGKRSGKKRELSTMKTANQVIKPTRQPRAADGQRYTEKVTSCYLFTNLLALSTMVMNDTFSTLNKTWWRSVH